ncbi:adenylate/guanylate cyclase domain-containing protein [Nannocystis sp.]|uniref:adenylate/guanylate cyclase domain-containing protein n=1 Tax=Nannocystis sp. TaxID=1962667 RepID=UPI0026002510|nr:adenylate/guanylate cyclase domain-containing protein [Nannocystis sp.]MBK7830048.1 adenylate/guanylate cyclase domain-containing response regulator [Nannocystis sp.]
MNPATPEPRGTDLVFAERPNSPIRNEAAWIILIVDDDQGVHDVTRLALDGLEFDGRRLTFVSAQSGREAIELLRTRQDIALVLLDVVMESDHAGLRVIEVTRGEIGNPAVRFVLRTGQPGHAPERQVITDYDISDYKTKGELTAGKLYTTVVASLRTYRHIRALDQHRERAEATATALQRFFPGEYLALLQRAGITEVCLGDQIQREMTVMFVDVRGFTGMSETMSPAECFRFINRLFAHLCPIVREQHGIIDKFLGDGFLALFPRSADDALQVALALQRRMLAFNAEYGENVRIGIGVHTGVLMLGTVGDAARMEATVLSDAVNLSARLEALTKRYSAGVILSQQTLLATANPGAYGVRSIGEVHVPGKQAAIAIYELIDADSEQLRSAKMATAADFAEAVACYQTGAHGEACMLLQRVLNRCPDDEAARLYLRLAAEALLGRAGRRVG